MSLAKLELCVTYGTINGFRTDRFSKDYRLTVFAGFLRVQIILQFYQTKQHRYLRLNDPLPIFSLLLL